MTVLKSKFALITFISLAIIFKSEEMYDHLLIFNMIAFVVNINFYLYLYGAFLAFSF